MTGTDKLIEKIIDEAKENAEKAIKEAEMKAEEMRKASASTVAQIKREGTAEAEKRENEILFRARSNAELDAKKADLEMRRKVVDKAFDEAHKKLLAMNANECKDFMRKLIFAEAEGGEEILPSKMHESMIKGVLPEINKMFLSEQRRPVIMGDECASEIESGFILKGTGYIKTCTFEELLEDAKEKELGNIADKLF